MTSEWTWPFSKAYTGTFEEGQQFGNTSYPRGRGYFHDGFDFGSNIYGQGSNVLAIHDGEVVYSGIMGSGLDAVIVLAVPPYQIMYQEFSKSSGDIYVNAGSKVKKGQVIGKLNGSHLHLGFTKKNWQVALGSWDINDGTWLNPISIIQTGLIELPEKPNTNSGGKKMFRFNLKKTNGTTEIWGVWGNKRFHFPTLSAAQFFDKLVKANGGDTNTNNTWAESSEMWGTILAMTDQAQFSTK